MNIKQLIKYHEGFSRFPYRDIKGNLTIGYGWNLTANGLPRDICEELLTRRIVEIERTLREEILWFIKLSDIRQEVLIDMAYCLGMAGLRKFKQMLHALYMATSSQGVFKTEQAWYKVAAEEILESDFARECPQRAKDLATAMETDSWEHLELKLPTHTKMGFFQEKPPHGWKERR